MNEPRLRRSDVSSVSVAVATTVATTVAATVATATRGNTNSGGPVRTCHEGLELRACEGGLLLSVGQHPYLGFELSQLVYSVH